MLLLSFPTLQHSPRPLNLVILLSPLTLQLALPGWMRALPLQMGRLLLGLWRFNRLAFASVTTDVGSWGASIGLSGLSQTLACSNALRPVIKNCCIVQEAR